MKITRYYESDDEHYFELEVGGVLIGFDKVKRKKSLTTEHDNIVLYYESNEVAVIRQNSIPEFQSKYKGNYS